jgi:hypothetical protein
MLNTILAIVAGFIIWSVVWLGGNQLVTRLFPGAVSKDGSTTHTGLLLTLIALSLLASLAAGYGTQWIAEDGSSNPQLILGVLLVLVGIAVQRQYWKLMPLWYHLAFLALIIPAVLYGATLAG